MMNKLDPEVTDELVDIALAGWKHRDNMGRRHRFSIATGARSGEGSE
jgi:hypothetical protein